MPCDLEVDTDLIRAAARLTKFAAWCAAQPPHWSATAPAHLSADGSAAVREALHLVTTRAEQSMLACRDLAAHEADLADRLGNVAHAFDTVESWCAAGG